MKILNFLRDLLLFLIALFLFIPLSVINLVCVIYVFRDLNYFRYSAINIDKFGNSEFRTLFNLALITKEGYKFGNANETISSTLGKNEIAGTLSFVGRALVWLLNLIDKDHCKKAIVET
jgi:hypothetical protein|nr:MAG TPA: hypothetical protein [Caudoviricetes sp.]